MTHKSHAMDHLTPGEKRRVFDYASALNTAISAFSIEQPDMTVTELRDYLTRKGVTREAALMIEAHNRRARWINAKSM